MTNSKKNQPPSTCQTKRRMIVTYGTINTATGKSEHQRTAWETRPCGTPLFTQHERATGTCRSCEQGWQSDENYPPVDPAGKRIRPAGGPKRRSDFS